jgi:hypothetical protein
VDQGAGLRPLGGGGGVAFTSNENGTKFPWLSVIEPRHFTSDANSPKNRFMNVKE